LVGKTIIVIRSAPVGTSNALTIEQLVTSVTSGRETGWNRR
jgi:hypothetical protein